MFAGAAVPSQPLPVHLLQLCALLALAWWCCSSAGCCLSSDPNTTATPTGMSGWGPEAPALLAFGAQLHCCSSAGSFGRKYSSRNAQFVYQSSKIG